MNHKSGTRHQALVNEFELGTVVVAQSLIRCTYQFASGHILLERLTTDQPAYTWGSIDVLNSHTLHLSLQTPHSRWDPTEDERRQLRVSVIALYQSRKPELLHAARHSSPLNN